MTMKSWLVRTLRRFVGNAAILLAAHEAYYRVLYGRPELPPAGVGRVELSTFGGSRTITDPAEVARILTIVRVRNAEWTRIPEQVCLQGTPSLVFYDGSERWGRMVLGPRAIGVQTPRAFFTRVLSPADSAELHRLLNVE